MCFDGCWVLCLIMVWVVDDVVIDIVEVGVMEFLIDWYGKKDFYIFNIDDIC